jgi:hypothetical protein
MTHKLLVEITIKRGKDGWFYPLYRAFGTTVWNTIGLQDGGAACFKDSVRAECFLEAVCDEFARDGFYCQSVEAA